MSFREPCAGSTVHLIMHHSQLLNDQFNSKGYGRTEFNLLGFLARVRRGAPYKLDAAN